MALALCVGVLVGAGPAPEDTEVTVGMGYGRYTQRSGGCAGFDRSYRVLEPSVDVGVRHRLENGVTLSMSGSLAPGVASIPGSPDISPDLENAYLWSGAATVQAGRHGKWLGFQLGPALVLRPGVNRLTPIPAGELWVGRPDRIYTWGALLPQPHTGALELAALGGLGHRSNRAHIEVGTSGLGWLSRAGVRIGDGVWLHGEVAGGRMVPDQAEPDLRGRVSLSVLPQSLRRAGVVESAK